MHFNPPSLISTISFLFYISTCLTSPIPASSILSTPLSDHQPQPQPQPPKNGTQPPPGTGTAAFLSSPSPPACPTQNSIAENLCSSGTPYCCSGSGASQVCGPRSTTRCETTTICCINTNGMQICAGEIDFTGPVTININL